MVTGLLRPDAGSRAHQRHRRRGADPRVAKRATRRAARPPSPLRSAHGRRVAVLLGRAARPRPRAPCVERSADLIAAFGLEDAVDRLVADYSAGMTKKIALACAMIHSPRLLVLDEPFESVDPVSAANRHRDPRALRRRRAARSCCRATAWTSSSASATPRRSSSAAGCSHRGTLDEVRAGQTLEDRFVELAGGRKAAEGMEWLHSFSD